MKKSQAILIILIIICYIILIADLTSSDEVKLKAERLSLEREISLQRANIERKTLELNMLNEQLRFNDIIMNEKFWFVMENKELFKESGVSND